MSIVKKLCEGGFSSNGATENSGVQPDWNQNDPAAADYVKNRTHYDEHVCIDWDGSTVNRQIIKSTGTLTTFRFIKMSEMTPSHELLVANTAKITVSKPDRYGTLSPEKVININSGNVIVGAKGWSHIEGNDGHGIVVVYEAGYEYTCTRSGLTGIYTFTEPGIYFTFYYNRSIVSGACTQVEWEALVPLDEKYIPDTIARKSDLGSLGGGGGGSDGAFVVNVTWSEGDVITADKTYEEVKAAFESGMHLTCFYRESYGGETYLVDVFHNAGYGDNNSLVFFTFSGIGGFNCSPYCVQFSENGVNVDYAKAFTTGELYLNVSFYMRSTDNTMWRVSIEKDGTLTTKNMGSW